MLTLEKRKPNSAYWLIVWEYGHDAEQIQNFFTVVRALDSDEVWDWARLYAKRSDHVLGPRRVRQLTIETALEICGIQFAEHGIPDICNWQINDGPIPGIGARDS